MRAMLDKFTKRSHKVMQLAQHEAKRCSHHYISVEHILLGLVLEEHGMAAIVLKKLGVSDEQIRKEVEQLVPSGEAPVDGQQFPLTRAAARTIEDAKVRAEEFRHDYVCTEHLLLGLITQESGRTAEIFQRCGITPQRVREEIQSLVKSV